LWVKDDSPNALFFTDSNGEDFNLGSRQARQGAAIAMSLVFGGLG